MEKLRICRVQQWQVRRVNQTSVRFSSDVRHGERAGERGGRRGRQQRGATPIFETEIFCLDDARDLLKVRTFPFVLTPRGTGKYHLPAESKVRQTGRSLRIPSATPGSCFSRSIVRTSTVYSQAQNDQPDTVLTRHISVKSYKPCWLHCIFRPLTSPSTVSRSAHVQLLLRGCMKHGLLPTPPPPPNKK